MSGTRYLLDTNAVIAITKGNKELLFRLNAAALVAFSIISIIEFLFFRNLTRQDKIVLEEIVAEGSVFNLTLDDKDLIAAVTNIRMDYRLKLPDAILAATAITNNCTLISNDKEFDKVPNLTTINFRL
jgi:predicted nucleic acid-binding protein